MRILALDTSRAACDLALIDGPDVLARHAEPLERGQDGVLALRVQALLAGAGMSLAQLDRVAVVTGPGSFTGTRIGVAFARGLGVALGVPVIGVSALHAALPRAVAGQGGDGLALVLRPAQVRAPDLTWWGQVFCHGVPRSLPFEMDEATLAARFEDWEGVVVAPAGAGLPAGIGGHRVTALHEPALGAARAALTLDPLLAPPVPAYVRAPDAQPRRAVTA